MTCRGCGSEVAPGRLSCPVCRALVHADELKSLAGTAEAAARAGNRAAEMAAWRQARELLPQDSRQFEQISARVTALSAEVDGAAEKAPEGLAKRWKEGGALATLGALLWKLKAVLLVALTKGKLLLLGLTKAGTLATMALSFGVYWSVFGWPFAAGLVLSIYVHEMGHVWALKRFGFAASLPMFVPGFGALIRLQQSPVSAREDARIGLAGPLWGLGAAMVAYAGFLAGGPPLLAALARWGAWVNLFNLLPVWQLDGGRAFRALARSERIAIALLLLALWLWTREGLLILLLIAAGVRAFSAEAPAEGDRKALLQFAFLLVALTALCRVEVPAAKLAPRAAQSGRPAAPATRSPTQPS
ncbi:MAG TPA: site-2 protease family protein, partial [Thermoanaerobaculia bacterium]